MLALLLLDATTCPSTSAPLPASPESKPLGSLALVVVPFVITVTFLI